MAAVSAASSSVTEDDIIRRRLLVDGDGMGDDRRLNMFMKMFVKYCSMKDEPEEERSAMYEKMILMLVQCEFSMTKSQQVIKMYQKEVKIYEDLYLGIEKGISDAQEKIIKNKMELQKAKRIRKNKQEYDALAKLIDKRPDRKETLSKLQQLKLEIASLQKTKEDLDQKLEKRRKQFQVLLTSAYELQQVLDEDNDSEGELQSMET